MRTYIIAEAGVNHNGDIGIAIKMVDAAKDAGCDAVKFQIFKPAALVSRSAPKAPYQKENTGGEDTQLSMLQKLELTPDEYRRLNERCSEKKIDFLATPFDDSSLELLLSLGVDIIKIPSGEIDNMPFLRKIGKTGKKIIISSGMATMDEINDALDILTGEKAISRKDIVLLHCNTAYPTPFDDANLKSIWTMRDELDVRTGYSDHTIGIEASLAAVALGAEVIEKHFTLDRAQDGPDHKASILPGELELMVTMIRNIEISLGDGVVKVSDSEKENISVVRKSIVAAKKINKGEDFREDNLTVKRPGTGLSPMMWDNVIGKVAEKDYKEDEEIEI
jgi:N,N'-diacetyllegionaminate synthase